MAKGLVPIAHPSNSLHVEPWSSLRTLVMSEMVLMVMAGGGGRAGVIRNKAKQIWVQMQSGPSAMHRRADGRDTSAHMEQTVYVLKLLPLKTLTPLS